MWSLRQQTWCCLHEGRGCRTALSLTSLPYDCQADFPDWEEKWSYGKKEWCCEMKNRGCQTTTLEPHNCKKGSGCMTAAHEHYDCNAGYFKFWTAWSAGKKLYCCKHKGRGCQPAVTSYASLSPPRPSYDDDCRKEILLSNSKGGHQDRQKMNWCCKYRSVGCLEVVDGDAKFDQKYSQLQHRLAFEHPVVANRLPMVFVAAGSCVFVICIAWRRRCCKRSLFRYDGYAEIPTQPCQDDNEEFFLAE